MTALEKREMERLTSLMASSAMLVNAKFGLVFTGSYFRDVPTSAVLVVEKA